MKAQLAGFFAILNFLKAATTSGGMVQVVDDAACLCYARKGRASEQTRVLEQEGMHHLAEKLCNNKKKRTRNSAQLLQAHASRGPFHDGAYIAA